MEKEVSDYINARFKNVYWALGIVITMMLGLVSTSYLSWRAIGKVEANVTYLKNARYVERDYFEVYMERFGTLITAHEDLCNAIRQDDLVRITHIEKDIEIIKQDIKDLGNRIGINTRSAQ